MKKNYTLKLVLAMLVVVLVSLVSFVGVYKGKNLLKDYSLGKDFSQRKVATFKVVEEEKSEPENTAENQETEGETATAEENSNQTEQATEENKEENENNSEKQNNESNNKSEPLTEEQKKKNYNDAKNNISKRLTAMKSEEFDIRLDENTGKLIIEVPSDLDSAYISQIVAKGKVQIKNTSSNEVIAENNPFKDASARMDTTNYAKPIVVLDMKFSKDAVKKVSQANTKYTDSDGNESTATFAVTIDNETLYSDEASTFVEAAKKGELSLVMGQTDEGEALEEDYQRALAITAIMECGEIPVEYEIESLDLISSNISIKSIVIVASIIGVLLLVYATYKFKVKGILSTISLVGLVATILLVLRYTNVKITLFTILGLVVITLINYMIIFRTLSGKNTFKENFVRAINILVPCIIVAIVFCCAPYLQLASFGMTIFWGLIVMCLYNAIITRIFIEK